MSSNVVTMCILAAALRFKLCHATFHNAAAVGGGHAITRGIRGAKASLARDKSDVRGARGSQDTLANASFDTSTDCLGWTGDQCHEGLCNPAIGPVSCQNDAYCVCAPGHCSTAGGECVPHRNQLVGKKTVLKNARFAEAHLALSCTSFDITTDRMIPEIEGINIVEMAHNDGAIPSYMLVSNEDHCAASFVVNAIDPSIHQQGFPVDLHDDSAPPDPLLLGVRFTSAPPYKGDPREHNPDAQVALIEVVASSAHGKTATLFADGFSIGVFNVESTQPEGGIDSAGYWVLDPPLPFALPPYEGPKCTFDCGSHGGGHTMSPNSRLMMHVVVFSVLFCFWFVLFYYIFSCFSRR